MTPPPSPQERAEIDSLRKEMEEFIYIASHDLQEPLRKILAFSDRLKDRYAETAPAAEKDYFDRMQSAAQRMKGMLEDLLTLSRVTSSEVTMEEVDLGIVLREVLGAMGQEFIRTGAEAEIKNLPMVRASHVQMRQLFQNLIANSVKFAQAGIPARIAVEDRGGDKEFVEIHVTDNGIGFEEKYLDRIFKPFQRLHGRGEYPGSGIGLAICQKIAQRHGGSITARGTLGAGATFIVRLPRAA